MCALLLLALRLHPNICQSALLFIVKEFCPEYKYSEKIKNISKMY